MLKNCNIWVYKGVSRVFHGCCKGVYGYFRSVSCMFKGCLMNVLRVFQGFFQEVSKGCFKEVSRVL